MVIFGNRVAFVDCFLLQHLQLIAPCKLQDGDTRLLKQLVEFVLLVLDRKPRLRLPIMLPMRCVCIE